MSSKFAEYLYGRLPEAYQLEDSRLDDILHRFIEVWGASFDELTTKVAELPNLIDIDKCPTEYLSLLAGNLGFPYDPGIDHEVYRRFLKMLGALYRRKGTLSLFKYLAREITGYTPMIYEGQRGIAYTWNPDGVEGYWIDDPNVLRRPVIFASWYDLPVAKVWSADAGYFLDLHFMVNYLSDVPVLEERIKNFERVIRHFIGVGITFTYAIEANA